SRCAAARNESSLSKRGAARARTRSGPLNPVLSCHEMSRRAKPPHADHQLGIHTTRPVPLEGLDIDGDNAVHGNRYEPTPYGVLEDMFTELDLDYPRFAFVDLGSGKGRILCLAAAYPFRRVIGVEFSRELHAIAKTNLAALPASWKKAREV